MAWIEETIVREISMEWIWYLGFCFLTTISVVVVMLIVSRDLRENEGLRLRELARLKELEGKQEYLSYQQRSRTIREDERRRLLELSRKINQSNTGVCRYCGSEKNKNRCESCGGS